MEEAKWRRGCGEASPFTRTYLEGVRGGTTQATHHKPPSAHWHTPQALRQTASYLYHITRPPGAAIQTPANAEEGGGNLP